MQEVIVFGHIDGKTSLSSLYEDDGSLFKFEPMDVERDVMTLFYSSGTTGLAKGVLGTHLNYISSLVSMWLVSH